MSRNYDYYDKQKAMVKLAHALGARGWKVYGYKADESDSMTDYWSPANCDGIYEKNGFILCVNASDYTVKNYSGKEHYKYNYNGGLSAEDRKKIEKLEAMTQERGASAGEEENAKRMIEKIKANCKSDKQEKELLYVYPVFQVNPSRCTWHIEKDNAIYEKGNNVYKFADLPYSYNERTGEIDKSYYRNSREMDEDEKKIINEFQAFILKLERIANNMNTMGDGTKETEEKAKEQESASKMIKVTVTETKKVIKPVLVDRKEIQINDILTFDYHGHFWMVTNIWTNAKGQKCVDYECLGSEKRGYQRVKNTRRYYQQESRLLKEMELGKVKLHILKEVEEIYEVEKWVKAEEIHKSNKTNDNNKNETIKNEKVENTNNSESIIVDNNYKFTITKELDTRDNSDLWVVRLSDKLDCEQWKEYDSLMRSKKGYYSKFKGGHIFKFNPTEILLPAEQQQEITSQVKGVEEDENINSTCNSDSVTIEQELKKENSTIAREVEQSQEENNNKNESEKVINMSSIFNKFQNVKIENTERISREDKEFCIEQQNVYNQSIKLTDSFIEQLKPLLDESIELSKKSNINSYSSSHKTALYHFYSIKEFEDKKQLIKNDFINFVIWYFRDKYNVTIDIEKVQKKYKDASNITYDNILDEIFLQLDGLTFVEKEEIEIANKLKDYSRSYRDNSQRTRVTKSKVIIDSFVAMDSWDLKWGGTAKIHYNYEINLVDLVKGLKHFTEGTTKLSKEEFSFARETLRNNIGEVHNVNYNNVESIKIYKNGKCEIVFSNSQYAEQFAKKYLSLSNVA